MLGQELSKPTRRFSTGVLRSPSAVAVVAVVAVVAAAVVADDVAVAAVVVAVAACCCCCCFCCVVAVGEVVAAVVVAVVAVAVAVVVAAVAAAFVVWWSQAKYTSVSGPCSEINDRSRNRTLDIIASANQAGRPEACNKRLGKRHWLCLPSLHSPRLQHFQYTDFALMIYDFARAWAALFMKCLAATPFIDLRKTIDIQPCTILVSENTHCLTFETSFTIISEAEAHRI